MPYGVFILVFFCAIGLIFSSKDPMWVYGEPVQLPNRQVLTCNLCGKKIFAGISRLKYHLPKSLGLMWILVQKVPRKLCILQTNHSLIWLIRGMRSRLANKNLHVPLQIDAVEQVPLRGDQQYHNPTPQPQGPQLLQPPHQPHLTL